MERIVKELPGLHWLRWTLLETRDLARRGTWVPPRPADIIKLTSGKESKLARRHLIIIKSLIAGLMVFFLAILGDLITGWIQQDVLKNSFTPERIVIIIGLTAIGIIVVALLQYRDQRESGNPDTED
jgi:H+/Cl- antiporter ClcA